MNKVLSGIIGAGLVVTVFSSAHAGWFSSPKKQVAPAKAAPAKKQEPAAPQAATKLEPKNIEPVKIPEAQKKSLEAQKLLVQEKRKRLNNTEWNIELRALSGSTSSKEKDKKEEEKIIFQDNQVAIDGYVKKGFNATNYTLTLQEDGTCVWETMQTSEKSGIAFWRGEVDQNVSKMQGVLSYHVDEKTTRDYAFISTSKEDIVSAPEKKGQ